MQLNPDGTLPGTGKQDMEMVDYTFTVSSPMTQAELVEEILYTLRAYAKKNKWYQRKERRRLISHVLDYVRRFDEITEKLKT